MSTLKVAVETILRNSQAGESRAQILSEITLAAHIFLLHAHEKPITRRALRDATGLSTFGVNSTIKKLVQKQVVVPSVSLSVHAQQIFALTHSMIAQVQNDYVGIWRQTSDLSHDANMSRVTQAMYEAVESSGSTETKLLLFKQFGILVLLLYQHETEGELSRRALVELTQLTPAAISFHLVALVRKGVLVTKSVQNRHASGRPELRYEMAATN